MTQGKINVMTLLPAQKNKEIVSHLEMLTEKSHWF